MKLKPGDAIATYNSNPFDILAVLVTLISHPVYFFKKGFWNIPNHIAVYVGNGTIVEALFIVGVKRRSLSEYAETKISFHRVAGISASEAQAVATYANECVGMKYDWKALIGFLMRPIRRLFRRPNPFDDKGDLYCSELYATAVEESTELEFKYAPSYCAPVDIIYDPIMKKIGYIQ